MWRLKQAERKADMFAEWRRNVHESKLNRNNELLAMTFYLKQLMKKILAEWNLFATMKVLRRLDDAEKVDTFVNVKNKLVARSVFLTWLKRTSEKLVVSSKEKQAQAHFENKLNRNAFVQWREHLKWIRYKKSLERRAASFLEMRLKTEFFFKWCIKYQIECELREKNERALLLWSIHIQKMCFAAWLRLHSVKREKKLRYKHALDTRQVDILKECARHFLKYSIDARQRRLHSNFFMKRNVFFDSVTLEAKYFYIWASKCRFKLRCFNTTAFVEGNKQNSSTATSKKQISMNNAKSANSLEKLEKITGCSIVLPASNNEFQTRTRPAPRKPNFLIDSIDATKSRQADTFNRTTERLVSDAEVNPPTAILLPPSAFSLPPPENSSRYSNENLPLASASETTLAKKRPFFHHVDFAPLIHTTYQYSTTATTSNSSVHQPSHGLGSSGSISAAPRPVVPQLSMPLESSRSENSKLGVNDLSTGSVSGRLGGGVSENELRLIEIKKRLETFAVKSDKLKRLKEQERLLVNWIRASEQNKNSMSETIYSERDQVQVEIDELSRFVKSEKHLINELLKQNKIF
jgi:hypothetical protein